MIPRALALLLVAPFLTFASALAPQHVHEPGAGHDHAVAHSHFGPHHLDVHPSDDTEIEHDVEHVVWLDSSMLHEPPYRPARVAPALPSSFDLDPLELRWSATPFDEGAPVHGPPKQAQLFRGPPFPLV